MLETVVTYAQCSKNKIHQMFQTEQNMSIRHEQAYNGFTNPKLKQKTKTCGKRDISGRRGLFHIDRVQVVEFLRRRKQYVLVQQILFHNGQSHLSDGCVCVSYPT